MKRALLYILTICVSTQGLAQVPGLTWAKNIGGPPDANVDGHSIAIDANGNVYTTGTFKETVDFNPGPGIFELTADDYNGFVSKVDANGNFVWAIQFGSDQSDEGNSITIDGAGNILVAGTFRGTVDFNPGAGIDELTSFGNTDVVVLKLTSAGNFVFAKQLGGIDNDFGKAMRTDASNNIYITGGYSDIADFNPDESTPYELTSNGYTDAFITKLDVNGNFQWTNSYGGDGADDFDNGEFLTIDPFGNIYLAGHYGQGDSGYSSVFIKKLDSDGTSIWEQEVGANDGAIVYSIQSDASGNIYYSGTLDGTADFNPLGTPVDLTGPDSYLCKLNSAGQVVWAKTLGFNSYIENANTMALDVNGNFFLGGFFQSTTFDVDPGPGIANLYTTSTDVGGSFILKLDNAGDYVWAQSFVNPSGTDGFGVNAITTDNAANIYFVGRFSETMDFATGVCLPNELTATSADLLIMKMGPTSIPATCFGVIQQPQASSIACQESSVFLTALAAGAPRISYQWQKFIGSAFVDISDQEADGESGYEGYEGTNTPYLTVVGIDNSGTGEFRCKVSADFVSDVFSDVATLIYTGSASIPYVVANSGCGPGQFMITASGGTEGNYRWYDNNGVVIDGQVNSTFTTPFISSPTEFSVSKTTAGCESDLVTVEVNTKACAPVPGLVWVAQPETSSGAVSIKRMTIDAGGNTYSVGTFSGTVDFDSGPGTAILTTADPEVQEQFLLKLDKDRNVVWLKSLSDTGYSLGMHISFDGSGSIYLAGGFRGTVDFDPGLPVFSMTSTGNLDMFISKFDTDGNFIWGKRIGGSTSNAFAQSIASDGNGVYVTGSFTATIDFDPGTGTQPLSSAGSTFFSDIYVLKLDATGNYAWAFRMGRSSASDGGRGIKVDASGNVYSIGTFSSTVDFDPGAGVFNLVGQGATDTYIHKVNNAGVFQWAKALTSPGVELPTALGLDASGNPYITGTFGTIVNQPSVDFDPGAGVTELFSAQGVIYVLKLNTNGDFVWAKNFAATFVANSSDITLDAAGNVLIVGNYGGDPDLDPGAGTYTFHSNVDRDVFVSKLDSNGNFSWAYNLGSTGFNSEGISILTDTDGSIYTAGSVDYSADLDPGHCTFPVFASYGTGTFIQKIKPGIKSLCFNLQPVASNTCTGVSATFSVAATGTTNITYQWQKKNTSTSLFENIANDANYSGTNTSQLAINTSGYFGAGDYQCLVSGDLVASKTSNTVSLAVNPNNPPLTTGATSCNTASLLLTASGGINGQYRWYDVATGGIPLGETSDHFTTPQLSVTTTYYVSILNGCESTRTAVTATIAGIAPTVTPASVCSGTTAVLKVAGGNNGEYRWYTTDVGGFALAGEVNNTLTIAALTATTSYYVSVFSNSCESDRTPVTATVFDLPGKPIINSSIPLNGNEVTICSQSLTLTAPTGFNSYKWSNNATTQTITLTSNSPGGDLSVVVTDINECNSPSSDPVKVLVSTSCLNSARSITTINLTTVPEGVVSLNLLSIISDSDNNLDPASLKIITQPQSGAVARIDSDGNLIVDYKGLSFSGKDRIKIEACDFSKVCTQQEITIDVITDVVVYNGVSPNGDGKNDFLFFQYIDVMEETKKNKVFIFNRWGDIVFEINDYNNADHVFAGLNKNGNELPSGNYFYRIDFEGNRKSLTGYFTLKR